VPHPSIPEVQKHQSVQNHCRSCIMESGEGVGGTWPSFKLAATRSLTATNTARRTNLTNSNVVLALRSTRTITSERFKAMETLEAYLVCFLLRGAPNHFPARNLATTCSNTTWACVFSTSSSRSINKRLFTKSSVVLLLIRLQKLQCRVNTY
jgi:hypothetical protein